jgi:broad specificity phosphatase PhoE
MTIALPRRGNATTRLILLRHGEPDETVDGRCYGRLDPGLSQRGREQMRRAWLLLANQCPSAIYSSPSRRAVESAALRPIDVPPPAVDERLREIDFGAFEGLTYDEISVRYPQKYDHWMARPTDVVFPNGENFAAMSARVAQAIEEIRQKHAGETVVTVSHGGPNRVALAQALELDPSHIFRLAQTYGCVNVIDYTGGDAVVLLMNATAQPAVHRGGAERGPVHRSCSEGGPVHRSSSQSVTLGLSEGGC